MFLVISVVYIVYFAKFFAKKQTSLLSWVVGLCCVQALSLFGDMSGKGYTGAYSFGYIAMNQAIIIGVCAIVGYVFSLFMRGSK